MKRSILMLTMVVLTAVSGFPVSVSQAYGELVDASIQQVEVKNTGDNPPRPRGSVKSGFNATSALDASISVGASGALNWSMVIRTPIGPGDSGPEVKLFYTGQRHGVLGYGMAASGLGSSIRRCNSTHQMDGYTKRFEWRVDDSLCLDGARLILDSGEYGSSGARYGVMGRPNVVVEARLGMSSDMPGSAFAVFYPSGRVDYYGMRDDQVRDDAVVYGVFDSDMEIPYAWHVSRSIDPSNNLTDYNYIYDDLSDKEFWSSEMVLDKPSHRLKEILYGGLKVDEASDLPHSRRVDLVYETVNEVVGETERVASIWSDNSAPSQLEWVVSDGFVGGLRYRNRHVLSSIESYAAGVPSWGYDFKYEKAPVSEMYKDLVSSEQNTPTTLRLKSINQRRTGSDKGAIHLLRWSKMRASEGVDRTELSGTGLDGKKFYSSPSKQWEECPPEYQGVVSCIERPIHQVWGDFDGDGHVEAMVAAYYVDSKLEDLQAPSGYVANTLNSDQVSEYRQVHLSKRWEMWNLADGKPTKVETNISIPIWNWESMAGISDDYENVQARPSRSYSRLGVMRDDKAHPAAWPIDYDGNARSDVLVGVPAVHMGGLFMDPPYGLGSETLYSNALSLSTAPSYCKDWESANEDERRICRNKVYRSQRSASDLDGHPGHLRDLKILSLAPESTPEAPFWTEQSLNYPITDKPMLWVQPLDLNGDGLTDLAFCKADENFFLIGEDSILPMFYPGGQNARYWTRGTLHYAMNGATGLDLSNGGTPFNVTSGASCDFRDAYTVMDLYGDGRQSLLTVDGNTGYGADGQRHLAGTYNIPNPGNGTNRSTIEGWLDQFISMESKHYRAYGLDRDQNGVGESMVSKATNLPLDLYARQALKTARISTWQAVLNGDYFDTADTGTDQPNHVAWNVQEDNPRALRYLQGGTYLHMDVGYGPSSGRVGDFNGDGLSDFAVIEHPGTGCTKVKHNDDTVYPRDCTLNDITGDVEKIGEFTYKNPSPVIAVYFNRGDASFERRVVSQPWDTQADLDSGAIRSPHFSWGSAQVVDIDKDGVSDIVWLDRKATPIPNGGGCGEGNICPDGYPSSWISLHVDLLPFYRGVDVAGNKSKLGEVKRKRILDLHPFVEDFRNDLTDPIQVGYENTITMSQTELSMKGHGAQVRLFDLDMSGSLDFLVYHNVASEWVYINGNPIDHGPNQSNLEYETGSSSLNKLVSSRNAMGALTQISYDRLDNRMIDPYTTQDSWQPYPFVYAPRHQSVVGVVKKDNGMGSYKNPDFVSSYYYYGKSRFDRLRGLSLGPDRRLGLMHESTIDGSITKSRTEYFNNAPNYSQEFRLYPQAGSLQRVVEREYGTQAGDVIRYNHTSKGSPKFGHGTVSGVMWKRSGRLLKSTWEVNGGQQDHNLLHGCLESVQDPFVGCDLDENNPNFQPLTLENSNTTFDELGFPLVANRSSGVGTDERHTVTTIEYEHRQFDGFMPYRLGLPIKENIAEYTLDQGGIPVIRQREFEYDTLGRVERIITDGHTLPELQLEVEENFTYDARGNIVSKTTQGADGTFTSEESIFESTGVFPQSRINALGMQVNLEFWPQCGVLRNVTSLAGHTEVTDVFESCDVHATQTFFGNQPLSARSERTVTSPIHSNHFINLWRDGVFIGGTEVNRVGQTIETIIGETDGDISVHSFYDRLGRLLAQANPVKKGEPATDFISYHYDQFGREVERIKPDGTSLKRLYNRHVITTIDELGHERVAENDSLGRPIRIVAPQDGLSSADVCVDYGMLGLATHVGPCEPNPARSTTEMKYDFRGRLEWMNDAQTGVRHFDYDSFDRLIEVTDAEGRVVRHEYDVLGRLSTLIEDYGTAEAQTHEWHWDQPFNGALQYASSPGNQEWGVYDQFNRHVGRRLRIDDLDLITRSKLDDRGRVEWTEFPSPAPVDCNDCVVEPLVVDFEYDELDRVVGLYHQNHKLWESGDRDIWGNLVEQRFGNDVVARTEYDELLGRLKSASVSKETILDGNIVIDNPIQEYSYQWYDNGWLKQRTRHNTGVANALNHELFNYYANGMLKNWDVSTESDILSQYKSYEMVYDSVGNILSSPMGSYDYQNERLSSVSGIDNEISYAYDANGNTIERVRNGLLSQLVYNARGNVIEVSNVQGNQLIVRNVDGAKVAVHWENSEPGGDDIIFKNGFENDVENLNIGRSTYYADGFELERGGELGNKIVARYNLGKAHIVREWSNGLSEPMQETVQYITPPDHLGSTTLVTNAFGNVVDERSYDAWGRERNPNAWNQLLDAPMSDVTGFNKGYTGHERRPYGNGLIDMNARYYDPYSYRMTQADSVVPDPLRMEDWNRYVYVRNAPTQYSDPTGHSPSPSYIPDHPYDLFYSAFYVSAVEFGLDHVVSAIGSQFSDAGGIVNAGPSGAAGSDLGVMTDASGESMNNMGDDMANNLKFLAQIDQLIYETNMKSIEAEAGVKFVRQGNTIAIQTADVVKMAHNEKGFKDGDTRNIEVPGYVDAAYIKIESFNDKGNNSSGASQAMGIFNGLSTISGLLIDNKTRWGIAARSVFFSTGLVASTAMNIKTSEDQDTLARVDAVIFTAELYGVRINPYVGLAVGLTAVADSFTDGLVSGTIGGAYRSTKYEVNRRQNIVKATGCSRWCDFRKSYVISDAMKKARAVNKASSWATD